MNAEVEVRMKSVRPFWMLQGRATVMPSDASEQQHGGIVIPTAFEGSLNRGVVIDVTTEVDPVELERGETVGRGTVVFYRGDGIKIGDVTLVDLAQVYAYEAE